MPTDDLPAPPLPRFLPTLTEVVQTDAAPEAASASADASARASPTGVPAPAAAPIPSEHALATVDELLTRLGPDLDRLIGEAIGRVLHEQMLGFNGRVQKAVAEVVREAVTKSLVQGHPAPTDLGEHP